MDEWGGFGGRGDGSRNNGFWSWVRDFDHGMCTVNVGGRVARASSGEVGCVELGLTGHAAEAPVAVAATIMANTTAVAVGRTRETHLEGAV